MADEKIIDSDSIFIKEINRGVSKGLLEYNTDKSKILYKFLNVEKILTPEEKVRASYFVELVLDYGYLPERIILEKTVPRRTPADRADIVIFSDDEKRYFFSC